MANLKTGTPVRLGATAVPKLRLAPLGVDIFIAVHSGALKAPTSLHTQVVGFTSAGLTWAAGLGEDLLEPSTSPTRTSARMEFRAHLLVGARLWEIVLVGSLLNPGIRGPLSTVYQYERPWLVIGEAQTGAPIAIPLNDASNPKWYSPLIPAADLGLSASKDSQAELAHAWTVRTSATTIGQVQPSGIRALKQALETFYA